MTGSRSPCAPCHVGVQDAAMVVVDRGRGPLMAKVDMQNAYRHIPIHPDDQWLMGMLWEGDLYINTALPIGLRSALKISMAIADAEEWVVKQEGGNFIMLYLDDFILLGAPMSPECAGVLTTLLSVFDRLGSQ